jgi:hypothetical protein
MQNAETEEAKRDVSARRASVVELAEQGDDVVYQKECQCQAWRQQHSHLILNFFHPP